MASVLAVFALISDGVEKELVAERAEDNLVELPLNEFVAIHLVNFLFAGANSALTAEPSRTIDSTLSDILLDCRGRCESTSK